jgi:hypothetical protein
MDFPLRVFVELCGGIIYKLARWPNVHSPHKRDPVIRITVCKSAGDHIGFSLRSCQENFHIRSGCFTTGISTLAHLLLHVTLRRFCSGKLRPGSTSAPVMLTFLTLLTASWRSQDPSPLQIIGTIQGHHITTPHATQHPTRPSGLSLSTVGAKIRHTIC